MFRFHKTLDIITLFHKAGNPASTRAVTLLKQISANASEAATGDQASDHSAQTAPPREEFELNITEDPPTEDQLRTILGYVGQSKVGSVVKGASSESDAIKKFRSSAEAFQRPVIVDWNNGKAVAGAQESEILKLLEQSKGQSA
ncbi:thioredoxin-like protein [Microdochium trichocladiopsis]|uniref:Thioredoxin-like protein n=1 Tax=Microdochium trichocladiopsis TaxID=1682393 RepID=A0A9P8YE09_9PEZI|nr:thioredoxin-like protein [Microdochium trichocladiopsis]KAH7037147.1 thioredoxin-like protein [Microdochium trichocladiopsis]